jgi:histidinol dehydrogenase
MLPPSRPGARERAFASSIRRREIALGATGAYDAPAMIPIFNLGDSTGRQQAEQLLAELRLDPRNSLAQTAGSLGIEVRQIIERVARDGDAALVDICRQFDDPNFTAERLRVTPAEMAEAAARLPADQIAALRRSISQVRQYQSHILPADPPPLQRPGVELGLRFTPVASAGLLVPGGKAAYPSTVIMLAVPAQVAGVKRIAVCTPASRFGQSDIVLSVCHELGLREVYRVGGPAAVAALAFGTRSIQPVDKILGPSNVRGQLAKLLLAGSVGIDGFLGPSEIVVIADDSAPPEFVAADLLAQAEHDPGRCFLLTNSPKLAEAVLREIDRQIQPLKRKQAIETALKQFSAIFIAPSMDDLVNFANLLAAEHVTLMTRDDDAVLAKLSNAGAVFVGPYSPVAAGDYVAGPSHCLPTNTTARFASGVSVYEFLKRSSVERYDAAGLAADAPAITTLAEAEHLDAHAASVTRRKNAASRHTAAD